MNRLSTLNPSRLALLALTGSLWTATLPAHDWIRQTNQFTSQGALQWTIDTLHASHTDIDDISVGPDAKWVVVAGRAIYKSAGIPNDLILKIQQYIDSGRRIDAVAIAPNGSWVVAAEDWFWRSAGVPMGAELEAQVKAKQNSGGRIREIEFTPGGGFVLVGSGNSLYGKSVPTGLWEALKDCHRSKRQIRRVSIGTGGRWLTVADQWYAANGINQVARDGLDNWQAAKTSIDHAVLGKDTNFVFYSHNQTVKAPGILEAIEYGLEQGDGSTSNIWKRIQESNVPGLSLAVIQNNKIQYARGYGLLEAGTERFVRTDSPYAVASLAKYVTSVGAVRMQRLNKFHLEYDARIVAETAWGSLNIWKSWVEGLGIWNPDLPYGMRARTLLSHTAAMNNNDTNDGWGGMVPPATILDTHKILLGFGFQGAVGPVQNRKVWYDPLLGVPGDGTFSYSNSGYEVVRGMMEDLNHVDFPTLMAQHVFAPLKMKDSTFAQPLSGDFEERAAMPHDESGAAIPRSSYQWLAGGGLYTTPTDYAKAMLVAIDQDGYPAFLSQSEAEKLTTDNTTDGTGYGLGIWVSENVVNETNGGRFAHGGYIPNMSWARMVGSPKLGAGLMIVVNSDTNAAALVTEIENAFRKAVGIPTL